MLKSKFSWAKVVLALFFLPSCVPQRNDANNDKVEYVDIAEFSELPMVTFPVEQISILHQAPSFNTIDDTIYFFQKRDSIVSVFQVIQEGENFKSSFLKNVTINLPYVALTNTKTFFGYGGLVPKVYTFDFDGQHKETLTISKEYIPHLQDSIVLYPYRGASIFPVNPKQHVPIRLVSYYAKPINDLTALYETDYQKNIFLFLDTENVTNSKVFGSLQQLSFMYNPETADIYNNQETKVTFLNHQNQKIAFSPKLETLFYLDDKGDVTKKLVYEYAKDFDDFKLESNHPNPADYITENSSYQRQWITTDGKYLIRVLKRGKTDDSQTSQYETPWEAIICNLDNDVIKVSTVLQFPAKKFSYGDIHFLNDKLLFISNKGIQNEKYNPDAHSYSIIDLSRYFK